FPAIASTQTETLRVAPGPPCHQHEERQRHQHAQSQQGDGVGAKPVAELDDDGLARERDGAEQSQADARPGMAGTGRRLGLRFYRLGFVRNGGRRAHASIWPISSRSTIWVRAALASSHSKLSSSM